MDPTESRDEPLLGVASVSDRDRVGHVRSQLRCCLQHGRAFRLKARLPDGTPIEVEKAFTQGGLAGVFGGKR